jgi:4-hydroxybenzoate polyprenyltransferase
MVRALVELLRLRFLPTAWADVLAGAFLAGPPATTSLVGALALSSGLYLFGMVTNDIFDFRRDARLYPQRPLPAGTITVRQAWIAAAALLALALAGSICVLPGARAAALVLLGMILAYNLGGKRLPVVGPILMGSCRALNLLLSAWAVAPAADAAVVPALALGAYVACVTQLSAWEGSPVSLVRLRAAVLALLVFPACLLLTASGGFAWLPLAGLALLIASSYPNRPFREGETDERLVHRLLEGIYLLDAVFLGRAGRTLLCGLLTAAGLRSLVSRAFGSGTRPS